MSIGVSPLVKKIADAIAAAEGYGVVGARPTRNNNPGDLTYAFGYPTTGKDGMFPIFATPADGYNALYQQVSEMVNDTSSIYSSDMTIADIGSHYAPGQPDWVTNVSNALGVSPDTPISEIPV